MHKQNFSSVNDDFIHILRFHKSVYFINVRGTDDGFFLIADSSRVDSPTLLRCPVNYRLGSSLRLAIINE